MYKILSTAALLAGVLPAYADYCFGNDTICGSGGPGKEVTLVDMQNWCMFLPPRGIVETVSDAEGCCDSSWCTRHQNGGCVQSTDAVTFCTQAGLTNGANAMVPGMWTSAHIVRDIPGGRIQITGSYNVSMLDSMQWIAATDEGGQFDFTGTNQYRVNSPPAGKPVGNNYIGGEYIEYVGLIGSGVFCLQMCSTSYGCNSDNDYNGCDVAIPGDYTSPGFTDANGTIHRQNSPPPNSTGLPASMVPSPLITAGPVAVASPGSKIIIPISSSIASRVATSTARATQTFAVNPTRGTVTSGASSVLAGGLTIFVFGAGFLFAVLPELAIKVV